MLEVIDDPLALVMTPATEPGEIQADAYGNARRRARPLVTVPVFATDGATLHPEFLELDLA